MRLPPSEHWFSTMRVRPSACSSSWSDFQSTLVSFLFHQDSQASRTSLALLSLAVLSQRGGPFSPARRKSRSSERQAKSVDSPVKSAISVGTATASRDANSDDAAR